MVGVTSETLRYYDRIGLVKPSWRDDATRYRYYTRRDVVLLNTVGALRRMGLPLKKIRQVLQYDGLENVTAFLKEAEESADRAIAELQDAKRTMRLARAVYEAKIRSGSGKAHDMPKNPGEGDAPRRHAADAGARITCAQQMDDGNDGFETRVFIRHLPSRVILPSPDMSEPTLQNLWDYLRPFYDAVGDLRDRFRFEARAGVYTRDGVSRLFAVCERYAAFEGLVTLPEGDYLCVDCAEGGEGNSCALADPRGERTVWRHARVPSRTGGADRFARLGLSDSDSRGSVMSDIVAGSANKDVAALLCAVNRPKSRGYQ